MSPLPIVQEDGLCLNSPKYLFPIKSRKNEYGHKQLYVLDILNVLTEFLPRKGYSVLGRRKDSHEFIILGVTNLDIYEEVGVEIMGRGTGDRVGVLSTYRYLPSNFTKKVRTKPIFVYLLG